MKVINHGKEAIDLRRDEGLFIEYKPIELHMKEDGAIDNTPSFCIVMERGTLKAYGQISLNMLNATLNELGYSIEKK